MTYLLIWALIGSKTAKTSSGALSRSITFLQGPWQSLQFLVVTAIRHLSETQMTVPQLVILYLAALRFPQRLQWSQYGLLLEFILKMGVKMT